MLKNLKKSLALTTLVAKEIHTNDGRELERLKDRLMTGIDISKDWYKVGLPLAFSTFFTVLCFALPQAWLWISIAEWLAWPGHYSMVGMLFGDFAFCVLFIPLMTLIARGNFFALKLYAAFIFLTTISAVIYFVAASVSLLIGGDSSNWNLIGSILGLVLIALSIKCLNSPWFVKSTSIGLHNRILRELSRRQKQALTAIKR